MYHLALLVIVMAMRTLVCPDPLTASTVNPTPQVTEISSKSPWKKIIENSCKKFNNKELCKYKDVITGSQSWQVLKLLGESGANLVQNDACGLQENSILCNSGKALKHSYNKLKLMLEKSLEKFTDRFPEDQYNGWSRDSIKDLFEGIQLVPDKTAISGFQNDRFQTEALLRLMGMIRLLQVRMQDFKINALMFAAVSLTMTLTVLLFYTGILVYIATQKCQIKLQNKKAKKLKQQERHFRRIIEQERRAEGETALFELN